MPIRLKSNCRLVPSAQSNKYVIPPRRSAVQDALRCMVADPEEVPRKDRQNSTLLGFVAGSKIPVRELRRYCAMGGGAVVGKVGVGGSSSIFVLDP